MSDLSRSERKEVRDQIAILTERLEELRARLEEPEEIVRAIRSGEVDALVVNDPRGEKIYSLRSPDRLYRNMVEEMKEGAAVLESTGLVVYSNAYFASLLRIERGELLGKGLSSFVPNESRGFFDDVLPPGNVETNRCEIVLRTTDGVIVPVHATLNRMELVDGVAYCLMVSDLTAERRRAELVDQSRQKDEFLAMLAHELRNPIAPIRNAAHVLRVADPTAGRVQWAREVIERQATQLGRLVDDLLDISRITRGKINLALEAVDLAGAVARGIETVRPILESRKQELAVSVPNEHVLVTGDPARLSQIVSNVLHNAAKFTPERGKIWIFVERRDGDARIIVRDEGIGIRAELLPRIFDLFTQGDSSLDHAQNGLGIGLALVRNLVEMQGGRIEAKSGGPGKGSEFEITFPIRAESEEPDRVTPRVSQLHATPRRVLVVDDNADSAESMTLLLRDRGHEVRMLTEGAPVLSEVLDFRPHLVLLDIGLPDVNGFEVARRIRSATELRGIHLVALTGYSQEEHRRRSREAGFDEHWIKPVDFGAVEKLLAELPAKPS